MTMISIVTNVFSLLTLLSDIFIVIFIFLFMGKKFSSTLKRNYDKLFNWLGKSGPVLSFIVSATATLGSLFYSEIAKYDPCKLCWFQRIFMYPQSIVTGIALIKKDKSIKRYMLFLSIMGILFSAYHYFIQLFPQESTSCSATGGISCSYAPFFHLGYITIPMMSFTAFFLLIIFYSAIKEN